MSESHGSRTQRDTLTVIGSVNPSDLSATAGGWEEIAREVDRLRTQVEDRLDALIGNDGWHGAGAEAFRAALLGRVADPLDRSAKGTKGLATELNPVVGKVRQATSTASVSPIPWDVNAPWKVEQRKLLRIDFEVRKPDASGAPQLDESATSKAFSIAQADAPYDVKDASGRIVKTVPVDEWRAISSQSTPIPPVLQGEVTPRVHHADVVFEQLDINAGVRSAVASRATGVESAFSTMLSAPSLATDPTYDGPNLPGQDGTLPAGSPAAAPSTPSGPSGSRGGPGTVGSVSTGDVPGSGSVPGGSGGSGGGLAGPGVSGPGVTGPGAGGQIGHGWDGSGTGAGIGSGAGAGTGSGTGAGTGSGGGWWTSGTGAAGVDPHGQFGVPLGGGIGDAGSASSAGSSGLGNLAGGALMSGAGLLGGRQLAATSGFGGVSATSGAFGSATAGSAAVNPSFSMGSTGRGTVNPGSIAAFPSERSGMSGPGGSSGASSGGSSPGGGGSAAGAQGGPVPMGRRDRDAKDDESGDIEGVWLEEDIDVWGVKDVRGEGLTRY